MMIEGTHVSCPKCGWEPSEGDIWVCDVCQTRWNTFKTHGKCPGCGKVFIDTACLKSKGGCGQFSLNAQWYESIEVKEPTSKKKFTWFWQKKNEPPITDAGRKWVENALLTLVEVFDEEYFKSLPTITPDKNYFDHEFDGTESDAEYILGRLMSIMRIDPAKIKLMFFSNPGPIYSGGLNTVNVHKANTLANTAGLYRNSAVDPKEMWIETSIIKNKIALISLMAHQLAHYKLLGERRRLIKNDESLTDLTAVVFGFGIFIGNAQLYLPDLVIAYALAWLAYYRQEDTSWKHYLNKTVKKYFERSLSYIEKNAADMKWPS